MKVLFINNAGAGFAGEVTVKPKTTVSQFFKTQMKNSKPEDCLIRVNRQVVTAKQVLRPGDRITITPTKIEGA
jgi:sulfur carrier protein ThiS